MDSNTPGIVHVILNRPEKLNALDIHMFRAIRQTILDLHSSTTKIRVVIVRGEGRAFSTGLDVPSLLKNQPIASSRELLQRHELPIIPLSNDDKIKENTTKQDDDLSLLDESAMAVTTNLAQEVGYLWRRLNVPVLCVMHGMCYGGGLQIALGADIRYATPDCQISIMESKWGLIPDMSATITLRELIPIDVAKELTMTGRIITGTEAQQLGLVTHCVPDPLVAAQTLAEQLVQKSPDAIRLTKQLYQQTWQTAATEEYCLELETEFQKKLLLSWNQMAASARNFGWNIPYVLKKTNTPLVDENTKT